MKDPLQSPYPWYGGKRRVSGTVWRALGHVPNYIEPFFGSGAVLLGRPVPGKIESVNDLDCHLVNFWRATVADPLAVAKFVDWPVNEMDLHARHAWLVEGLAELRGKVRDDPHYYDTKRAGWWVWGLSAWIGGEWCSAEKGPGISRQKRRPDLGKSRGIQTVRKRPNSRPRGVHTKRVPPLRAGDFGEADAPSATGPVSQDQRTTRTRLPSLGNNKGVHGLSKPPCEVWFQNLRDRMRHVRVCCGDWRRVVTPAVMGMGSGVGGMRPCGVFLDPPYSHDLRSKKLYAEEDGDIAEDVAEWARENGDHPELRIVLCGLEGEHDMPSNWTSHTWRSKGYGSQDKSSTAEVLWMSPHCLPIDKQMELW